jgi:hypothetical protein
MKKQIVRIMLIAFVFGASAYAETMWWAACRPNGTKTTTTGNPGPGDGCSYTVDTAVSCQRWASSDCVVIPAGPSAGTITTWTGTMEYDPYPMVFCDARPGDPVPSPNRC